MIWLAAFGFMLAVCGVVMFFQWVIPEVNKVLKRME